MLAIIALLSLPVQNLAQQTPYLDFYQNNWPSKNIAVSDIWQTWDQQKSSYITFSGRYQWFGAELGHDQRPLTLLGSYERFFRNDNDIKWGIFGYFDKTDAIRNGNLYGRFVWTKDLNHGILTYGFGFGGVFQTVNASALNPADPTDEVYINATDNPHGYMDVAWGLAYNNAKNWYCGLAMPQAVGLVAFRKQRSPHWTLMGGKYFSFNWLSEKLGLDKSEKGGDESFLELSALVEGAKNARFYNLSTEKSFFSARMDARLCLAERFWLGSGYGTNKTWVFQFGFETRGKEGNVWAQGKSHSRKSYRRLRINASYSCPADPILKAFGNAFEINFCVAGAGH